MPNETFVTRRAQNLRAVEIVARDAKMEASATKFPTFQAILLTSPDSGQCKRR